MDYFEKMYLVWRRGRGGNRFPVAVVEKVGEDEFTFKYLSSGVEKAKKEGFEKYVGFPDVSKIYSENVLDILAQRLPKSQRFDLEDFYAFWLIDKTRIDDSFYMLAQTQGQLPTDNYEFLADYSPRKGLEFISEVAGLSYFAIDKEFLNVGDKLEFEKDPENPFDQYAVKLKFEETIIGYVKLIHSKIFYKSDLVPIITIQHLEKNGSLKKVFIRIEF